MILLNSQSKKKEEEGSKLDNVKVKQLLSQSTFTHLLANDDEDGSEDDDVDEVGGGDHDLINLPPSFLPIAPAQSEDIGFMLYQCNTKPYSINPHSSFAKS